MRRRLTLIQAIATLFVCGSAVAQTPDQRPSPLAAGGMPPHIGVIDGIKASKLQFRVMTSVPETRTKTVQETVTETVDGKAVSKTVPRQVMYTAMATVTETVALDLAEVRAFNDDGKPIPAAQLTTLFGAPRMILWSYTYETVDPGFLKIARPGTPFVSIPAPVVLPGPVPSAAPPPPAQPAQPTPAPAPPQG